MLHASVEANHNLLRKQLSKAERKLLTQLNHLKYERSDLTDAVERSVHLPLVWSCVPPCGLGQTPARAVPTMRTAAVCAESIQEPELSSAAIPTKTLTSNGGKRRSGLGYFSPDHLFD